MPEYRKLAASFRFCKWNWRSARAAHARGLIRRMIPSFTKGSTVASQKGNSALQATIALQTNPDSSGGRHVATYSFSK